MGGAWPEIVIMLSRLSASMAVVEGWARGTVCVEGVGSRDGSWLWCINEWVPIAFVALRQSGARSAGGLTHAGGTSAVNYGLRSGAHTLAARPCSGTPGHPFAAA